MNIPTRRQRLAALAVLLVYLVTAAVVVVALFDDFGSLVLAVLVALQLAGRLATFRGWHAWTTPEVEIRSAAGVAVGVDGEALVLDAPLRFEVVPGALVRVARSAPGVSPARVAHAVRHGGLVKIVRVALGKPIAA